MIDVREADGGATFAVKASAGAKRNAVVGLHGGALKVAVSAPRDKGRANEALVEVLAKALNVPKKAVAIVKGETSADKRFLVAGWNAEALRRKLEELVNAEGGGR
jgi:uncharacterized protein (TIGR00251 family)